MFSESIERSILFLLSGTLLYCFEIVIEKYLMENKYITIFEILFYEGCVEFCINLVVFAISFIFLRITEDGIKKIVLFGVNVQYFTEFYTAFSDNLVLCILEVLANFVIEGIIELFLIMTLFYLNPNYCYVSDIVSILLIWILEMIKLGFGEFIKQYWPLSILGYFTILIGALIYNEIIIIYICGLEHNTKKEIRNRAGNNEEIDLITIAKQHLIPDSLVSSDL